MKSLLKSFWTWYQHAGFYIGAPDKNTGKRTTVKIYFRSAFWLVTAIVISTVAVVQGGTFLSIFTVLCWAMFFLSIIRSKNITESGNQSTTP